MSVDSCDCVFSSIISIVNCENVVKPPNIPVSRNKLIKLFCAITEYIIPNRNEPTTFTSKVEN